MCKRNDVCVHNIDLHELLQLIELRRDLRSCAVFHWRSDTQIERYSLCVSEAKKSSVQN